MKGYIDHFQFFSFPSAEILMSCLLYMYIFSVRHIACNLVFLCHTGDKDEAAFKKQIMVINKAFLF